jgi:hypothetical protein
MKRWLGVLITIAIFLTPLNAVAAVKAGDSCKKAGAIATANGKKFTCIKSGKKLVWNKGVKVIAVATPTPSPTPSPTSIAVVDYFAYTNTGNGIPLAQPVSVRGSGTIYWRLETSNVTQIKVTAINGAFSCYAPDASTGSRVDVAFIFSNGFRKWDINLEVPSSYPRGIYSVTFELTDTNGVKSIYNAGSFNLV